MMIRQLSRLSAVVAVLACALPLSGQDAPGSHVPVSGTVQDLRAGTPIPAASVRLLHPDEDRTVREAQSDGRGRFNLEEVPLGSYRIEVSALAYHSISEAVDIVGLGTVDIRIDMVPEAFELDPVVVVTTTTSSRLARSGFFERQQRAIGTFLTRDEILRRAHIGLLSDVFRTIPGARVVPGAQFGQVPRIQFRGGCEPPVWVDGLRLMAGTTVDDVLSAYDVEAMEIYRGITTPAPFLNRESCGAIAVWTRDPGRGVGTEGLLPSFGRTIVGLGAVLTSVFIAF